MILTNRFHIFIREVLTQKCDNYLKLLPPVKVVGKLLLDVLWRVNRVNCRYIQGIQYYCIKFLQLRTLNEGTASDYTKLHSTFHIIPKCLNNLIFYFFSIQGSPNTNPCVAVDYLPDTFPDKWESDNED